MARAVKGRKQYDSFDLCCEIIISSKDHNINLSKLFRDLDIPEKYYRTIYSIKTGNRLPPLTFKPELEESLRKLCEELDIRIEMYERQEEN